MKYLVTGGTGWIGSSVCRQLEDRGSEAIPFDRVDGNDITDPDAVTAAVRSVDHVIHLAGVLGTHELFDHPMDAVTVNIGGTLNILEAIRQFKADGGGEVGYTSIVMPKVNPSLYSATKNCAMDIAHAYREAFGIPVSHVIAYNAFGPGQHVGPGHPQKILPTFACRAWAGLPIPIWGDGQLWTDLVHVDDVARMMVDAADFEGGQIFDGGTGQPLTVLEIAREVQEIAGDHGVQWLRPRPGERMVRTDDDYANARGWSLLQWQPIRDAHRFEEAVLSYRDHPEVDRLRREGA